MITPVNIAFYEKKYWDYFLTIIDDRDNMPDSWDDWYKEFMKVKTELVSKGFHVREITINLNELIDYCIDRKIKLNGEARALFVQTK